MFIKRISNESEVINYMAVPGLLNDFKLKIKTSETEDTLLFFLNFVSEHTGVSIDNIKGKYRGRDVVIYRQLFCYISKKFTNASLKKIGFIINRDHSTTIHSIKTINNLKDTDDAIRNMIYHIEEKLIEIKRGTGFKYEIIG